MPLTRDKIEAALLAIVHSILERDQGSCTMEDDLLALGADSLKVMQVRTFIEEDFSVELSPTELLEARSLREIADLIMERCNANEEGVQL